MILRLRFGQGLLSQIARLLPCVILVPWLPTRIPFLVNILRTSSFISFWSSAAILPDMILIGICGLMLRSILLMELIMSRKKRFERMEFFTLYNPPPKVGTANKLASVTRQEFAKDADINNIMAKYAAGMAPIPSGSRPPQFGDFSDGLDYQACLDKLIAAQNAFDSLPSKVRDRFGNDPAKLLDFLSDPSNRDEALKLGLIDVEPPEPVKEFPDAKDDVSVPEKGAAE